MHGCNSCHHSAECVRLLPERKVWACGFDGCKGVFLDWSRRCKHIANHYNGLARRVGKVKETPAWKYSVTVRNLLRQPDTRDHFKKFMIKSHGHSKTERPALNWQRDSSAELKRRLEYRDFPDGVVEIVQQAYRLGHPANMAAVQDMSRPPTPPLEGFNLAHLSSIDGYFGSTGPRSARSQRSYLYERKSNSSTERAAPKTASLASSRCTGRKRLVAREAEVRNTSCSALASFLRDGTDEVPADIQPRCEVGVPRIPPPVAPHRSRLVAREAEVRNTRNPTLASILRDGPPDVTDNGESHERKRSRSQSIPRLPAIRVAVSPFADYVDDGASLPRKSPTPVLDPRAQVVSHDSQPQMTGHVSRPQIFPPKSQPHSTLQKPLENPKTTHTSLANRRQKPQLREIQSRENLLNLPCSSSLSAGTWVLPPTPGPPPIMALPKTPATSILSPMSITSRNFSDGPISPVSPTNFNFDAAGPPPSPMPPEFSEIKWPLPPTPAVQLLLECIPTSTTESFREVSLTSGSLSSPRPAEDSPVSTFRQSPAVDGSRVPRSPN
ncbi:glucose-regulated [Venturia nashicola]|nr:glucose-regulated [Venturia nashicola]